MQMSKILTLETKHRNLYSKLAIIASSQTCMLPPACFKLWKEYIPGPELLILC